MRPERNGARSRRRGTRRSEREVCKGQGSLLLRLLERSRGPPLPEGGCAFKGMVNFSDFSGPVDETKELIEIERLAGCQIYCGRLEVVPHPRAPRKLYALGLAEV